MLKHSQTPERKSMRRRSTDGSDLQAAVRDLRLKGISRRTRVTAHNVAAVCTQLGDMASTRNVQRVLGGSLRDIAPLVKAWREGAPAGVEGSDGRAVDGSHVIGAMVMQALEEQRDHLKLIAGATEIQGETLAAVAKLVRGGRASKSDDKNGLPEIRNDLRNVLSDLGDLRLRMPAGVAEAMQQQLVTMGHQIEAIALKMDSAPASAVPATIEALPTPPVDLSYLLVPVIDRIDALAGHLSTQRNEGRANTLQKQDLEHIVSTIDKIYTSLPASNAEPSTELVARLDALLVALNNLPAALKEVLAPAPKRTIRKAAVKTAVRKAQPLKRVAKKSAKQVSKGTTQSPTKAKAKKAASKVARKAVKKAAKNISKPVAKKATNKKASTSTSVATRKAPSVTMLKRKTTLAPKPKVSRSKSSAAKAGSRSAGKKAPAKKVVSTRVKKVAGVIRGQQTKARQSPKNQSATRKRSQVKRER